MKVGELIGRLQGLNPEAVIVIERDGAFLVPEGDIAVYRYLSGPDQLVVFEGNLSTDPTLDPQRYPMMVVSSW